jgi:hypothetical protein
VPKFGRKGMIVILIDSGGGDPWADEDVVIECNIMVVIVKAGYLKAIINDFHIQM